MANDPRGADEPAERPKKGYRPLHIDGMLWFYEIGTSGVDVRGPARSKYYIHYRDMPEYSQRDHEHGNQPIQPQMIKNAILRELGRSDECQAPQPNPPKNMPPRLYLLQLAGALTEDWEEVGPGRLALRGGLRIMVGDSNVLMMHVTAIRIHTDEGIQDAFEEEDRPTIHALDILDPGEFFTRIELPGKDGEWLLIITPYQE